MKLGVGNGRSFWTARFNRRFAIECLFAVRHCAGIMRSLAFALSFLSLAACGSPSGFSTLVDTSVIPADLPRSALVDLDPDVQRAINRGFVEIDRRLGPVCTPEQVAQAKEALVIFGWATTSTTPNPPMLEYAQRRGPEIRAARTALGPECAAATDELVQIVRRTQV